MNILTQSLWRDEAFSALISQYPLQDIIRLSAGDSTPALYYLVLHISSLIFGGSEIAMRVPGIIFFLLTVAVMYLICQELKKGLGWWLAAVTLTQPLLFNYAFEARAYSLLALLTALTVYFYLKKSYLPLILSGVALLYTHLFGIWVVLILLGWSVYKKQAWLPFLAPLILFLPWLPNYFSFARLAGTFLGPPDLKDLFSKAILLGLPALLITAPTVKKLIRHPLFGLAFALTFIPLLGAFIISQFKPFFLERYLIICVPGELMLLGLSASLRPLNTLLAAVVVIQAVVCGYVFIHPTKPPFAELASYIKMNHQVGDTVLDGSSLTYFESQYYQLDGKIYSPKNDVPYYIGKVLIPDSNIVTYIPAAKRYFLINLDEPGGTLTDPFPASLTATKEFGKLKLSTYVAP
jgi:uncharacterized membrane protein